MTVTLRGTTSDDAAACGRICYEAFCKINDEHRFPHDFPSVKVATDVLRMMIDHPGFHGIVAERDGKVIGSNFLDERSSVVGLGPITVDPAYQNQGVGRLLMQGLMERAESRDAPGVRLCQSSFHLRSMALYTILGFRTREPLAVINGAALKRRIPAYHVRTAELSDFDACNEVCYHVHGFHRGVELKDAIEQGTATVVEHNAQITGYATDIGFFAHSVGRTNKDLMALIAAACEFTGPGFLLPTRNHEVFAWCLANGLRIQYPMTLMTTGLYNEPAGAYLVCVLY